MSLPIRIAALFAVCLLLASCGFKPLYSKQAQEDFPVLAGVRVDSMPGREGQVFKAELEDKLNPSGVVPGNPAYRLRTDISASISPIGVARDGTISRYNVYLSSRYSLYRLADDRLIASGNLNHVSGYNNVTNAYFSTYVAERDAIRRGLTELAEVYRHRLGGYLINPSQRGVDAEADDDLSDHLQEIRRMEEEALR